MSNVFFITFLAGQYTLIYKEVVKLLECVHQNLAQEIIGVIIIKVSIIQQAKNYLQ
jgi:hypothetical protein